MSGTKLHDWPLAEEAGPWRDTHGLAALQAHPLGQPVPATILGGRVCPDFVGDAAERAIVDSAHRVPSFGRRSWGLIAHVYVRQHRPNCWPITHGGSDQNVPGWRLGVLDNEIRFQLSDGRGEPNSHLAVKNTHVDLRPGIWHEIHVHVLRQIEKVEVLLNGAPVILAHIHAGMGNTAGDPDGLQHVNYFSIGAQSSSGGVIENYSIDGSVSNVSLWAL